MLLRQGGRVQPHTYKSDAGMLWCFECRGKAGKCSPYCWYAVTPNVMCNGL